MDFDKLINNVIARFIGTKHERDIKVILPKSRRSARSQPNTKSSSDEGSPKNPSELRAIVAERLERRRAYRARLRQRLQEALAQVLVPAFALVREPAAASSNAAFRRAVIGGIVLHEGKIAEMKTGEGKTLVATFPAYLNALAGRGVHIVTVNDYLARRDAEWMSPIYRCSA